MPLKLGDKVIKLPFSKAYLGSVLKYQKGPSGILFNVCPFPTTWNRANTDGERTATDDYGSWKIYATSSSSTSYNVADVFDGVDTGLFISESLGANDVMTITIECPILIMPKQLYLNYGYFGENSYIEALNATSGEWEKIATGIGTTVAQKSLNIDLNISTFYSKFRICSDRVSASYNKPRVSNFQITSGLIKI